MFLGIAEAHRAEQSGIIGAKYLLAPTSINFSEERLIMKSSNELRTMLRSIDHKSYPAYKSLAGTYQFGTYLLSIDHVQDGA